MRVFLLIIWMFSVALNASAQRNCGFPILMQQLKQKDQASYDQFLIKRNTTINQALSAPTYHYSLSKSTAEDTLHIATIVHFVIDSLTFRSMGNIEGIERRLNSQLNELNLCFNGNNPDQHMIPSVWKPIFANVGINFNKARIDPNGNPTLGYTITIVPPGTRYDPNNACKAAKFSNTGGIDAWPTDKYLNIWVTNIQVSGSTILGITAPTDWPEFTKEEWGICVNHRAFGVRTLSSENFVKNFDKGKTLVHEIGHYFNLSHTWGDDGGLCPSTGGIDDGITDTPPQAGESTGKPSFPRFDACSATGSGVMFYNYLDYSDDSVLVMFTEEQKRVMRFKLSESGDLYSLTQFGFLSDSNFKVEKGISIFPNPTTGQVSFKYNLIDNPLHKVTVYNQLGQLVLLKETFNIQHIDLSSFANGYYYIKCEFKHNNLTKTIILNK
jgi:hypothetical protein